MEHTNTYTYMCLECNKIFEFPRHYVEQHGLNSPPYEEWFGCPFCAGTYKEIPRIKKEGDYYETL